MSNYLTVAAVTETLRQLLNDAVSHGPIAAAITGAEAKAVRPSMTAFSGLPNNCVNIFLYQVNRHAGFTNGDLPMRRADGSLSDRPRAALTLNYLLSFHSGENELNAQALLGKVVQILHAQPVLTPSMISAVTGSLTLLHSSDLADEIERVKLTPISLTLDDLSKLWSTFFQTPYVLSIAYQASVVFIEGDETPRDVLPVRERRIHVMPFDPPVIESVSPQRVVTESSIIIHGRNLRGDITKVKFGDEILDTDPAKTGNNQIEIDLPSDLPCGVNTVQIIHDLDFQTSEEPHRGFESNVGTIVVCPVITTPDEGTPLTSGTITIGFTRPVGKQQSVSLLLYSFQPPAPAGRTSYSFQAPADNGVPSGNETTDSITFHYHNVDPGKYLVRMKIDGAESGFELDPVSGVYTPHVTIA